jgi:hypothetical protein
MGIVTTIIDALRSIGSPTQRTAIERQDEQLKGKRVIGRRRHIARSELGQTSVFVATTQPEPETVVPLSAAELKPILENAELVVPFLNTFLERNRSERFLDDLDEAFEAWSEANDKRGYTDEAVVEIVGAAFGSFCSENLRMRWIRVSDADGSAIAIQGTAKDFRGFPYHAISKRIPSGEYGSLSLSTFLCRMRHNASGSQSMQPNKRLHPALGNPRAAEAAR